MKKIKSSRPVKLTWIKLCLLIIGAISIMSFLKKSDSPERNHQVLRDNRVQEESPKLSLKRETKLVDSQLYDGQDYYYQSKMQKEQRINQMTLSRPVEIRRNVPVFSIDEYLAIQNKFLMNQNNHVVPLISKSKTASIPVYVVAVVSVDYEKDLFPYYIDHYENKVGIPTRNMRLVLHSSSNPMFNTNLKSMLDYCTSNQVPVMAIWSGVFESFRKRDLIDEVIENTIPQENAWVMHTDTDEFHDYSSARIDKFLRSQNIPSNDKRMNPKSNQSPLQHLLHIMQEFNLDYVMGNLRDRIANDCGFHDALRFGANASSLFNQYPCTPPITAAVMKGMTKKIMLYRSHLRSLYGGHHGVEESKIYKPKPYPNQLIIDHFKWRGSVLPKIEQRRETFKKNSVVYDWWIESDRFLKRVTESEKGKVIKVAGCPCLVAN